MYHGAAEFEIDRKSSQGASALRAIRDARTAKNSASCGACHQILTGINFLAFSRLRVYTRLPPVDPSEHNLFSQTIPPAPSRPFPGLEACRSSFQNHPSQTIL